MRVFFTLLIASLIASITMMAPSQARASEQQFAVSLPIKVRIIDFATTKQICGAVTAPGWCPAHLLVDHSNTVTAAQDVEFEPVPIDASEFAKRERINKVKQRIGYKRNRHTYGDARM